MILDKFPVSNKGSKVMVGFVSCSSFLPDIKYNLAEKKVLRSSPLLIPATVKTRMFGVQFKRMISVIRNAGFNQSIVGKDESQIAGQLTKVDRLSGGLVPPFYETLIID